MYNIFSFSFCCTLTEYFTNLMLLIIIIIFSRNWYAGADGSGRCGRRALGTPLRFLHGWVSRLILRHATLECSRESRDDWRLRWHWRWGRRRSECTVREKTLNFTVITQFFAYFYYLELLLYQTYAGTALRLKSLRRLGFAARGQLRCMREQHSCEERRSGSIIRARRL